MSKLPLDSPEEGNVPSEPQEMSFLDHLEELRWHILRACSAVGVLTIAAFASSSFIFGQVILGPSRPDFWTYIKLCELSDLLNTKMLCIDVLPFTIQSREMTGQFTMHITSSFAIGLIIAFPYVFWEIWRFVSPGLYFNEKKVAKGAVFFVSLLFLIGILFGYYIITPLSVNFLAGYQLDPSIINQFDIISYVSTVTTLVLACGILFQLPMVVLFLTKSGIITPNLMRTYRKHGVVIIFILGALLTPPDPFSQVLVALPLLGLYEMSIIVCSRTYKKMQKKYNQV